jgi:hypothetical protein
LNQYTIEERDNVLDLVSNRLEGKKGGQQWYTGEFPRNIPWWVGNVLKIGREKEKVQEVSVTQILFFQRVRRG